MAHVTVMETPELVLHILQFLPRTLLFTFRRINWTWYHAVHQFRLSMGEFHSIARQQFESRPRRIYTLSSYMLQYGPMTHEARSTQGRYKFIFSCQTRSGSGDSTSSSDSSLAAGGLLSGGEQGLELGGGSRPIATSSISSHMASASGTITTSSSSGRGSGSESHSHESSHLWIDHDEPFPLQLSQEPHRSFRAYRSSAIVPNISFRSAPSSVLSSASRRRAESTTTATLIPSTGPTDISLSDLSMAPMGLGPITSASQTGGAITGTLAAAGDTLTGAGDAHQIEPSDTMILAEGSSQLSPSLESLSISPASIQHPAFGSHISGTYYPSTSSSGFTMDVLSQHPLDPTPPPQRSIGMDTSVLPLQPALTPPDPQLRGMYRVVPCPYDHPHEEAIAAARYATQPTESEGTSHSYTSSSETGESGHSVSFSTPHYLPTSSDKGKGRLSHDHPDTFGESSYSGSGHSGTSGHGASASSGSGRGSGGHRILGDILEEAKTPTEALIEGEGERGDTHGLDTEHFSPPGTIGRTMLPSSMTESSHPSQGSGVATGAGSMSDDPSILSSSYSGHISSGSERRPSSASSTHTTTAASSGGNNHNNTGGHPPGSHGNFHVGLCSGGGGGGGGGGSSLGLGGGNGNSSSGGNGSGSGNGNGHGHGGGGNMPFSMRDPNWTAKIETFYFRQAAINAMIVACRHYMRANERFGAAVIERTATSRIVWNEATRQEFIWTVTPTLLDRSNPTEQEPDYDESESAFMY
ncbi:hypothetical protein BGZ73_002539 [Actinomortierella ambigua]|nr:hypothetical protein BGZ73_002539 [Actinomortierella ambigua]